MSLPHPPFTSFFGSLRKERKKKEKGKRKLKQQNKVKQCLGYQNSFQAITCLCPYVVKIELLTVRSNNQ